MREISDEVFLATVRHHHTRIIIGWIDANPTIRVRLVAGLMGEVGPYRHSFIKATLLRCLGSFRDPEGSFLELHVRLIETAMSMLDWDAD